MLIPGIAFPGRCRASLSATTGVKTLSAAQRGPPSPFTLARLGFKPAVCHPSSFLNCPQQRVGACAAFAMLVARSRLPFASLQTPKLSAAALHCVLLGAQDCRLPAFKALNPPQRPYTLSCWGFKSAVCRPSNGSTLHSGPTQHCLVQTAQPSAAALHTVLLGAQDYHLPPFKPLNAPQRPYTLSCGGFKTAGCEPPNPSHTVLLGLQECQPSNP